MRAFGRNLTALLATAASLAIDWWVLYAFVLAALALFVSFFWRLPSVWVRCPTAAAGMSFSVFLFSWLPTSHFSRIFPRHYYHRFGEGPMFAVCRHRSVHTFQEES